MNFPKMDKDKVRDMVMEGKRHLSFVVSLYRKQLLQGRHFLHEHPATAMSWKDPGIRALASHPLVSCVVADQCQYGLLTPSQSDSSKMLPALKPTRFMTSSPQMAKCLQKRCDRSHVHQQLVGGRAAAAAFYPLPLIRAILKGMRDTAIAEGGNLDFRTDEINAIQAVKITSKAAPTEPAKTGSSDSSQVTMVSGGVLPIGYKDENYKTKYLDEYTGETLPETLIRAAIREELDYFNDRVWQICTKDDMAKYDDHIFVRSRWVMCNKGDAEVPDCRARLVACEVNKTGEKNDLFYASTPPLEAKKAMFDRYSQHARQGKHPLRLSFVDVRKAYFNGTPKRNVFMTLPKELGLPSHFVAKQVRCVYGTRDAGSIWEDVYRGALEAMGFESAVASPCCFVNEKKNISVVVHGDDFTALGTDQDLDWYETELAKHFELKIRGRLGEGCPGDNELRILNRVVRITPTGLTYEADPRHADLLAQSMTLTDANSVATPGVKDPEAEYQLDKRDEISPVTQLADPCLDIPAKSGGMHHSVVDPNSPMPSMVNAMVQNKCVSFSSKIDTHFVTPYSEIYGIHPSQIKASSIGFQKVPSDVDPYTSKSGAVMQARAVKKWSPEAQESFRKARIHRRQLISDQSIGITGMHALRVHVERDQRVVEGLIPNLALALQNLHGIDRDVCIATLAIAVPPADLIQEKKYHPACEDPLTRSLLGTLDRICATRTPPAYKKGGPAAKRQGAKAVKKMERSADSSFILSPEEATLFRALSARANFLSQDRPDINFSTKELCREFAAPTQKSYLRLKRLVRYLVGVPRLVYFYPFLAKGDKPATAIDLYVDTDFAGCKETRRSTSGGVAMAGKNNIKHWSKTQTTIALSSGEAELNGIGAGIAMGMGVQSICRDLGYHYDLRVHTDETAAIGIARRRGMGKIRHLDTTDLWVQEKIRTGRVELLKVPGQENPADVMTKYVDKGLMSKMLMKMGMMPLEGRAKCAPAIAGVSPIH